MSFVKGQYGYDLTWLQNHQTTIELVGGESRVLLSADFQGRVMTSTTSGKEGYSFGWINHDLIASENRSEQFNAFGGEERFWLGPEGGQFSLYFENGKPMNIENWKVPQAIDTMAWEVQEVMPEMATFFNVFRLKNYTGTEFQLEVTRRVGLILPDEIALVLNYEPAPTIKVVAYETLNQVKNGGEKAWTKVGGLPSIWMLSMYNPSPDMVIIAPFNPDGEGAVVKSDYFGEIPEERLKIFDNYLLLKADGKYRSKIGINPSRSKRFIGSYDPVNFRLTILETTINPHAKDYVNSAWDEFQKEPFKGDLINAYNDGPLANGTQLGPFYELESSSEALQLAPGESHIHIQRTYHFEGAEAELNELAKAILGVSLSGINQVFS